MSVEFVNAEQEYLNWLAAHPDGYVINTTRNRTPGYMVLHRATCSHISNYNRMAKKGGFTTRSYAKICGESIRDLRGWAAHNGRPDGSFSKECSKCHPL